MGFKAVYSVSAVLNGQRPLSDRWIDFLTDEFKWSAGQRAFAQALTAESKDTKARAKTHKNPRKSEECLISEDQFRYICEWHHLALKSYIGTADFRYDLGAMERRFRGKISGPDIHLSFKLMERLGLIQRGPNKTWAVSKNIVTSQDIPSQAIRQHHRGMLQRAVESIEQQDLSERDISSTTFVFDKKHMAEAKAAIEEFREEFRRRFSATGGNDVYQLNIQLFGHTT
jgi:uncharacterized protein (TIGR02147 family)